MSDTSTEQNGTDLTESKELFTTADVTDMFADVTDERADVTDKCADVADMCPDVTNTCTDVTNTCTDDCGKVINSLWYVYRIQSNVATFV